MSAPAEDRAARLAGVEVDREPDPDVLAGLDVTDKNNNLHRTNLLRYLQVRRMLLNFETSVNIIKRETLVLIM